MNRLAELLNLYGRLTHLTVQNSDERLKKLRIKIFKHIIFRYNFKIK